MLKSRNKVNNLNSTQFEFAAYTKIFWTQIIAPVKIGVSLKFFSQIQSRLGLNIFDISFCTFGRVSI